MASLANQQTLHSVVKQRIMSQNLFAANSFVPKKALKLKVNCDIIQQ
jgi:hypothetical protein